MEAAKLGLGGALMPGLLRRRPSSCSSSSSSGRAAASASSIVAVSNNNHRFSPAASFGTRLGASAAASAATTSSSTPKEKDLAFVAGATGRVGSRAVRELIKLGFRVRAAVRDSQRASALLQSVQQLGFDDAAAAERLELVECDLEKQAQEGIVSAIGNAAVVVCSIGASEKEILDVTGPYRIDYMATNNLVQADRQARGNGEANGCLQGDAQPGGGGGGYLRGGQVSNLQVAELIAYMASNRKAAYCKVVEVIAETTAPLLPFHQLLSTVPSKREPPAEAEEEEEEEVSAATAVETPPPPPAAKSKSSDEEAKTEHPLSPYTAYEGLKPPSSPSPMHTSKQ